ncbi:MAG: SDR family NAD(P)-dependent oxidoreductase [Acidimicrobiia bacterium]|nr:SDR family NAD(P)-dependent oxidoreductase [Acidimicrobiia bacterium]
MGERENWTEADIPDQSGRVAFVTGANSGLGFEAARALAQHGADVIMGCRDAARAADAKSRIDALGPSGSVEVVGLDLADLDSVAGAAKQFLEAHEHLDLLVNNAGLMASPQGTTAQGFETQIGVNHLGHFALTARLLPALLATPGSRVVTVSSQGHRPGRIQFDDLHSRRKYSPWRAYFQSKLANLLFTLELQRRLAAAGAPTISVAAHPGAAGTHLGHENPGGVLNTIATWLRPVLVRLAQSPEMGALPILRAATDPAVRGGDYYGPRGLVEQSGYPVKVRPSKRARDEALAARLWDVSIAETGADYSAINA